MPIMYIENVTVRSAFLNKQYMKFNIQECGRCFFSNCKAVALKK